MFNPRDVRYPGRKNRAGWLTLGLLVLTISSCADSARAKPSASTLGSEAVEVVEADETGNGYGVETDVEGPWAAAEKIPTALGFDASAQEIKAAVSDIVGPTNDVAGQMNRLVAFPDLPIPERAEVIELRVDSRQTLDTTRLMVTVEVAFGADGTVSEIVEFYGEQLGRLDATSRRRAERVQDGVLVQLLDYQLRGDGEQPQDLMVEIRSASALAGRPRSRVDLRLRTEVQGENSASVERLVAWASDLPLPTDGLVTGAGIQTSAGGRNSLYYTLSMIFDRKDPATVAAEIRAALPAGGYVAEARDPVGDETDNWIFLSSAFFDEALISIHDGGVGGRARTLVSVDARVDLDR